MYILSTLEAISAACASLIIKENGVVILVDDKVLRGGRIIDATCRRGDINFIDISSYDLLPNFWYGLKLSIMSSTEFENNGYEATNFIRYSSLVQFLRSERRSEF
ncbi:hypothetical protein C2G38_2191346 [Gigaspora rosea]|uniref:Uncharacterized protein n=1 Tax=Gigaspora rosea TaxID=44941 RepID=A0A397V1N8_9GLOM|nr:hypothetical protein C2G38_2191346 [Gigaspora rosea]